MKRYVVVSSNRKVSQKRLKEEASLTNPFQVRAQLLAECHPVEKGGEKSMVG